MTSPCGLVTTGGTGSILHAILAYREHAAQTRGVTQPNVIKPETAHPAFDKACHLFGVELRRAPVDPVTTQVDVDWVRDHVDERTVALIGSACNYGYGTVDPIAELSEVALGRGIGLHVDACLGGFILPFGRELGYDIPAFDYAVPGVTSISADTHKYGYAFKGSSVLSFRSKDAAQRAVLLPDRLERREVHLSGHGGLALGRPHRGHLGRHGAARTRRLPRLRPPDLRDLLRHAGGRHRAPRATPGRATHFPVLLHLGRLRHLPRQRLHADQGWRFNGQQYPNALHMAVTRPQTQPRVVSSFAADLADAVDYAKAHAEEAPRSGAIYGGVAGGMTDEADEFIRAVMADMLDGQSSIPA